MRYRKRLRSRGRRSYSRVRRRKSGMRRRIGIRM